MTFKSTIETLSETLSEAELDGVAGRQDQRGKAGTPPALLTVLSLATSLSTPVGPSTRSIWVPSKSSRRLSRSSPLRIGSRIFSVMRQFSGARKAL
jgi:hypothetical protein